MTWKKSLSALPNNPVQREDWKKLQEILDIETLVVKVVQCATISDIVGNLVAIIEHHIKTLVKENPDGRGMGNSYNTSV
jgi:hypothetical protein